MQPVFADPKTDYVFKRIFGVEARKPLLIALLNHLLELEGERRIQDVQHRTASCRSVETVMRCPGGREERAERTFVREHAPQRPTTTARAGYTEMRGAVSGDQHIDVAELKLSIVDVKCTDATGRRFVVEMQVLKVEGFEKRVVYNASKAYVMQLRNAEEYPALCDVVGVTICNFNLWSERDEGGRFKVPMLSRWRMQEQHSGERGLPQVQYVFLELPKYRCEDAPETLIERWAYFFREARNLEVIPPALSEAPFRDALEVARTATFTPEEWEAYERAKMAEQDARGALAVARQEGALGARRDTLFRLLARAGMALSEEEQARVHACADAGVLDRWIDNVFGARSAADVLS